MSFSRHRVALSEPNHRQHVALERIEFAIAELATVLLASSASRAAATDAIGDIRRAVAPIVAGILGDE